MANKSVGQIVGTIAGAIVGSFIPGGYVALGAAVGGAIGGAIDPPSGPDVKGPRLNDLSIQQSSLGLPIPRVYGKTKIAGNVFWVENNQLRESEKTESQGGKGGGGTGVTTYSYSATFALGLCEGPISGVLRIWCSGKLLYDGGASSLSGVLANEDTKAFFTVYHGGPDQQPCPRMEATLGAGNVPGYKNLAWILIEDFPLGDFGNSLMSAQFWIEVVTEPLTYGWTTQTLLADTSPEVYTPAYPGSQGGVGLGSPYITDIHDGMIHVAVQDSAERNVFSSVTGKLIETQTSDVEFTTGPNYQEYFMAWANIGHPEGRENIFVKFDPRWDWGYGGSGVVAYGPIAQDAGPVFYTEGARLDAEIIDYRVAHGVSAIYFPSWVCIDVSGLFIFVHTTDDDRWYLIDLDGHIVDTGIFSYTDDNRGYGQSGSFAPAIDYANGTFVISLTGSLWVYKIGADKAITLQTLINVTSCPHTSSPMACVVKNDIIYIVVHAAIHVLVYGLTDIADITLGEIVNREALLSRLLLPGDIDTTALTQVVRGYKINQAAPIRTGIEPLQHAWPFDIIPDGYQLRFVPRTGTVVATIDHSELGASDDGKQVVILSEAREMDSQLPRRVVVQYLDEAREYDTGEQYAERLNTDAVNVVTAEMALVLTADEAAQMAERMLYLSWLERRDLSFTLPPSRNDLQPGDVVTLTEPDRSSRLRLTQLHYLPTGVIEVNAKFEDSSVLTSTAVGSASSFNGQVLGISGETTVRLLDLPSLTSVTNAPGFIAGLGGYFDTWPGGTLMRTPDTGQTWESVQGFDAPGAVIGTATTVLATGNSDMVDTASRVNLRLIRGTLESVTDAQLFNGRNHFAIGAHGRWEIVGAKTATLEADGTWTLSNLMRGRFGSERYMGSHAIGDQAILLDAGVYFVGMDVSRIGIAGLWRGVTRGKNLDSATDVSFTYGAVNLKPLAPILLNGHRALTTADWTLLWTRRSRTPVEPFSGLATPLGEAGEAYEVEIFDETYTTLKRTFTGLTAPTVDYTAAQQTTDFGDTQQTLYVRVYQLSAVLGRGYPMESSITRMIGADPFGEQVVFALHLDGTNGSTTFTDVLGKTVTAYGNAQLTTTAPKFGTACATFDGAGDYLSFADHDDFDFGSSDLTIDFWFKTTQTTAYACLIGRSWGGGHTGGWSVFLNNGASGPLSVWWAEYSFDAALMESSTNTHRDGNWHHFAWTRSGNDHRMFLDGVQVAATTNATAFGASTQSLSIASDLAFGGRDFNGQIDDLRITRACRWTSAFTPPTAPFPDP